MLVIEANNATAPRMRIGSGWSWPVTMIDPTTAIAEVGVGPGDLEGAAEVLRRFARLTAADESPADRSHCRACPFGPGGMASCPEAPARPAAR